MDLFCHHLILPKDVATALKQLKVLHIYIIMWKQQFIQEEFIFFSLFERKEDVL
jgi:hypothetical protein